MDNHTRNVLFISIGSIVLVIFIFVARDLYLRSNGIIQCDDGSRKKVDIRDFTTTYWAYAVEFDANIGSKAKFSGKLHPKQLQELSEAAQQAGEFRKFLVAGFNSCAITKAQFEKYGRSYQALDGLSRQINSLASQQSLSTVDKFTLSNLVKEYSKLTNRLVKEERQ